MKQPVRVGALSHKVKTPKIHSLKDPHWSRFLKLMKPDSKEPGWSFLSKERKGPTKEQQEAMAAAASIFVSPNVTYTFRLVASGTSSSSAGTFNYGSITWDPTGITEYANYLSFMFNETRIRHAKVTIVPEAGGGTVAYALSSDLGFTSTAPASTLAVTENANSFLFTSAYNSGTLAHLDVPVPNDYLWAATSAPCATANAGCYGQFQFASLGVVVATDRAFSYLLELYIEFRSRT